MASVKLRTVSPPSCRLPRLSPPYGVLVQYVQDEVSIDRTGNRCLEQSRDCFLECSQSIGSPELETFEKHLSVPVNLALWKTKSLSMPHNLVHGRSNHVICWPETYVNSHGCVSWFKITLVARVASLAEVESTFRLPFPWRARIFVV